MTDYIDKWNADLLEEGYYEVRWLKPLEIDPYALFSNYYRYCPVKEDISIVAIRQEAKPGWMSKNIMDVPIYGWRPTEDMDDDLYIEKMLNYEPYRGGKKEDRFEIIKRIEL